MKKKKKKNQQPFILATRALHHKPIKILKFSVGYKNSIKSSITFVLVLLAYTSHQASLNFISSGIVCLFCEMIAWYLRSFFSSFLATESFQDGRHVLSCFWRR